MKLVTGCILGLSLLFGGCAPGKVRHFSRNTAYSGLDLSHYSMVILPVANLRMDSEIVDLRLPHFLNAVKGPDLVGQKLNDDFCHSLKKYVEGPRVWCEDGPVHEESADTSIILDWVLRKNNLFQAQRSMDDPRRGASHRPDRRDDSQSPSTLAHRRPRLRAGRGTQIHPPRPHRQHLQPGCARTVDRLVHVSHWPKLVGRPARSFSGHP